MMDYTVENHKPLTDIQAADFGKTS
uniref:Uncharacterized protein n=1 Tax=Rhizophora mucronata TaxID=61149 RepID=A0A2P2P829_RHIMU